MDFPEAVIELEVQVGDGGIGTNFQFMVSSKADASRRITRSIVDHAVRILFAGG